jgi:energy-coupling factor transporter ATP-binding protein EcfA2
MKYLKTPVIGAKVVPSPEFDWPPSQIEGVEYGITRKDHLLSDWVYVQWYDKEDNMMGNYGYRVGAFGAYDLCFYEEEKIVNHVHVGAKVKKGKDWAYGEQAKGAEYGIIETTSEYQIDNGWANVIWYDHTGKYVSNNAYRVGNMGCYDLYYYDKEYTTTASFNKNHLNTEDMQPTTSQGFQVMIPEQAIHQRVDALVDSKLNETRLQSMMHQAVNTHRQDVVKELRSDLHSKITCDLHSQREEIIESFLESKRTDIYLNSELKAVVTDPLAHKEMPRLLSYLQLFKQAMIVGPTGSGKSTLAKQAANALSLRYGSFSCNAEASKSELIGFQNLNGYVTSQFLDFYENGGVFLIDEYDAMSPSIAVVLNAAFDRTGQISVANRQSNPIAKKHQDFYCILAGNTWGSGSVDYQGREMQDKAFLDRFKLCRIHIDYDETIEKSLGGDHYNWFMKIRNFMNEYVEGEKFSTRSIYDASMLMQNGFKKDEIVEMISSHWEPELVTRIRSHVGV